MPKIYQAAIAAGLSLSGVAAPLVSAVDSTHSLNLSEFEKHVFSQNGEDGILEKLFEVLGVLSEGYFVELGALDGAESNTRYFRENYDWQGLLFDNNFENLSINLHKEPITAESVNELLERYGIPEEFDLLSIDLDYNDFHVWKALDSRFSPKVVIVEYNASHRPTEDLVAVYNPATVWDGSNYYGGSLLAFTRLGNEKGYSLVCTDRCGVNAVFIRNDLIEDNLSFFTNINDVEALYNTPKYGCGPFGGHVADPHHRNYEDSFGNFVSAVPK